MKRHLDRNEHSAFEQQPGVFESRFDFPDGGGWIAAGVDGRERIGGLSRPALIRERIGLQFFEAEFRWEFPPMKHALCCHHLGDPARYGRFSNINITVHDSAQAQGEFGAILPLADPDSERLVRVAKSIHATEEESNGSPSPVFSWVVRRLIF